MEGYSDSLDLFTRPAADMGLLKRQWVDTSPINSITEDSPIEFNIPANTLRYIDLSRTFLNVKIKVLKQDGTEMEEVTQLAPVNLTLHSLWRQVDFSLGQVPLPGVGVNYSYKAIIDTLLEKNATSKESQLQGQFYHKDTAGKMDATKFGSNYGFNWRHEKVSKSITAELEGPLFVDLAQQDKCLINSVPINIKLWPSNNRFRLMVDPTETPPEYKIHIEEASLKLCKITVNPKIILAHDAALKYSPALYYYMRSDIKTYSIAEGSFNVQIDNIFNGQVPSSVVVGLVAGDAYNGNYVKNPYNFQNFNVNWACFYVDDNPTPQKGFSPVYLSGFQGNYTTSYLTIFGNSRGENFGNDIYLDDFAQGYALYKFNISNADQIKKKGSTRLELSFKTALTEVVTVIVYAKFPHLLRVNESRRVLL